MRRICKLLETRKRRGLIRAEVNGEKTLVWIDQIKGQRAHVEGIGWRRFPDTRAKCYLCLRADGKHTRECLLTPANAVPLGQGKSWRAGVRAGKAVSR